MWEVVYPINAKNASNPYTKEPNTKLFNKIPQMLIFPSSPNNFRKNTYFNKSEFKNGS
jgi:hypothetical protein